MPRSASYHIAILTHQPNSIRQYRAYTYFVGAVRRVLPFAWHDTYPGRKADATRTSRDTERSVQVVAYRNGSKRDAAVGILGQKDAIGPCSQVGNIVPSFQRGGDTHSIIVPPFGAYHIGARV